VVSIITTQRTIPHRNSAGTPPALAANGKKYNTFIIACGTPAVRQWLPQAHALPTFSVVFVQQKTHSVRCVTESLT